MGGGQPAGAWARRSGGLERTATPLACAAEEVWRVGGVGGCGVGGGAGGRGSLDVCVEEAQGGGGAALGTLPVRVNM